MSITIDNDSALTAFKAEILKSLSLEQREKILSDAVEHVLKLSKNSYGDRSFKGDVISSAITLVMRETVLALLKEPEAKAKLDAAARTVVQAVTDKLAETLVNQIDKAIRGY